MTVRLTRTVRFCINEGNGRGDAIGDDRDASFGQPRSNTFAAWPAMVGLGRFYEMDVTCRGEPNPTTGYFLNIKTIDEAVRAGAIPLIARAVREDAGQSPAELMRPLAEALDHELQGALHALTWRLTPTFSITLEKNNMALCTIRQQFSFAASHRLHCPELSDAANREIFGKCNNKNGHGHNYRLEVAASIPADANADAIADAGVDADAQAQVGGPRPFSLPRFERIVRERVIDRFDHKHLNIDCPEFADLNPSVEHIARVCYELLEPALAESGTPLREVVVWETEKTSCVYPG